MKLSPVPHWTCNHLPLGVMTEAEARSEDQLTAPAVAKLRAAGASPSTPRRFAAFLLLAARTARAPGSR
jgi:hypothetical protein